MTKITYLDLENACPRTRWYGIDFEHDQTVDLDQITHLTDVEKEEMIGKAKGNRFFIVHEGVDAGRSSDATEKGFGSRRRRRGAPAKQMPRVLDKMRVFLDSKGADTLRDMTEEAMKAEFGASRDTCRKARETLLSKNDDN
jgi:hypothetical protein